MAKCNLSQEQQQYFENLKVRYQAANYEDESLSSVLYLILSKTDLNQNLLDIELNWLQANKFFKTINLITQEQKFREKASVSSVKNYKKLVAKYKIQGKLTSSINPFLMFILCKLDSEYCLDSSAIDFFRSHNQTETLAIIEKINYFADLKQKYFAHTYKILSLDSPLYSILQKLDIIQRLTDSEITWLEKQNLWETLEIYQKQEDERIAHFCQLKSKYNATQYQDSSPASPLHLILQKLEQEQILNETEINWLQQHDLKETLAIIQEIENKKEFASLKIKYKATDYEDLSPACHLYRVLKNIESGNLLNESDFKFLKKRNLTETIDIVKEKYLEQLKDEYKIYKSSQTDIDWLKQQDFIGIKPIDDNSKNKLEFAILKIEYKATAYEDSSPDCHLYRVLKILKTKNKLNDSDINYLKKHKLTQTIQIAIGKYANYLMSKIKVYQLLNEAELAWLKENGYENIVRATQEQHFLNLKNKYGVSSYKEKSLDNPLYVILQKLEREERLEETDVVWLKTTEIFVHRWLNDDENYPKTLFSREIKIKYNSIEVNFYEEEYKRTGNKWNLPNASSHWRGAEEPEKALNITDNLDFEKIKENKLKSALFTTRGGAFRDLGKLNEAEKCALKAIEYYPQSFHPYTLMGAICYDRGNYPEGDYWFAEARKRGYSPESEEAEIKRIFNKAESVQKLKLAKYLKNRYSWAKKYLDSLKNKTKISKM